MSNIIPPLLSDSPPPPPPDIDDHDDDEFGDFTGTNNLSYDCDDSFSPPPSPIHLPKPAFDLDDPVPMEVYDINSNSKENNIILTEPPPLETLKDFHDKRKDGEILLKSSSGTNLVENSLGDHLFNDSTCQSIQSETSNRDLKSVPNGDEKFDTIGENVKEFTTVCNNDSLSVDTSSHNLKERELTCFQKIDEIVVTNCDTKTTSNQNKSSNVNSIKSEEFSNETLSIDSKNNEQIKSIDDFSDSLPEIDETDMNCVKAVERHLNSDSSESKSETQGNISGINGAEEYDSGSIENISEELIDQIKSETDDHEVVNKVIIEGTSTYDTVTKFDDGDLIVPNEILPQKPLNEECTADVDNFSEVSVKPTNSESSNVTDPVSPKPPKLDVNDDFGDFSTATDVEEHILETKVNDKDGESVAKEVHIHLNNESENNDFGDFTVFPSFTEKTTAQDSFEYLAEHAEVVVTKSSLSNEFQHSSSGNIPEETSQRQISDDDFGDFTTSHNPTVTDLNDLDEDDFGSFVTPATNVGEESSKDSDFGDFTSDKATSLHQPFNSNEQNEDFEDFACFPSTSQKEPDNDSSDDGDDFGDFTTSSVRSNPSDDASKFLLLNEKQALNKAGEILKEMFPVCITNVGDFELKNSEMNDKIFNQIKSITETHALSFHWPKSASQKLLLKALNIDSRNIMFGPGWNPSMPRFAANLSQTPLEPIKSEILTPTSANEANPSNSSRPANVEVPQFDLGDLELMDPLDSLPSKDTNISTEKSTESFKDTTKDIPVFSSFIPQPSILTEANTSTTPTKTHLEDKVIPTIQHDDFNDFISHSTSQNNPHGHSILLRETHISNKELNKSDDNDIVSYLEPTIVTPELSRKDHKFIEPEDEFDDFQMVVPVSQAPTINESSNTLTVKPLKVLKPAGVVKSEGNPTKSALQLDFFEKSLSENVGGLEEQKPIDDDFGDFTYSLPSQPKPVSVGALPQSTSLHGSSSASQLTSISSVISLAPTPVLQPLQPSVVHSQTSSSAKISWPDPGITEDELTRFEAYSRIQNNQGLNEDIRPKAPKGVETRNVMEPSILMVERSRNVEESYSSLKSRPANKLPSKAIPQTKQTSLDDDEWSDFVSVQNPSPIHKLKTDRERSSTPDLPLSVLNLGSVQPAKQPIPVITPNGLMQTKLSSNMSLNFPSMNLMQSNRSYPQPQQTAPVYQPSIISNQYASQAYGGFSNYGNYHAHSSSKTQVPDNTDDDEWSDFVSHQPAAQKSTQPRHSQGWSTQTNNQFSSWTGMTPNIITNPSASFDSLSGSAGQRQAKKITNPAQIKKSGVPNVAIPDLDFLAPRSRTSNRK